MKFPTRFATGVRNTTVVNPAWLHRTHTSNEYGRLRDFSVPVDTFEGLCSEYDFGLQSRNFKALQDVLHRHGTDFLYVAAARYKGNVRNHRFVACSADGSLVWNKYVGFAAQGGQNHVYVAGMRIKVSVFLGLKKTEQNALLSGSKRKIDSAIGSRKIGWMNEDGELWN